MRHISNIFAAQTTGLMVDNDLDSFWTGTTLGGVLGTIMDITAVIIIVYALYSGIRNFAGGKIGTALRGVIGAMIVAAFLFNPELITTLISGGAKFIKTILDTFSSVTG